jgi:hypothetical protein
MELHPDTSSNIKVYVRVRPANDSELVGQTENIVSVHSTDTVRVRLFISTAAHFVYSTTIFYEVIFLSDYDISGCSKWARAEAIHL